MNSDSVACSQCGSVLTPETSCSLCFEALLGFEAERPRVFAAVHHLTVATYSLQHPAGYRRTVLAAWHRLLADALDNTASLAAMRQRLGKQFAGSTRVLEAGALPPDDWPTEWTMRVQDVFNPLLELPSEDEYVERARLWASTTRATLDSIYLDDVL